MYPKQRMDQIKKAIERRLKVIQYTETVLNKAKMTNNWKKVERSRMTIKRNTWIINLMKKENITEDEALEIIYQQEE